MRFYLVAVVVVAIGFTFGLQDLPSPATDPISRQEPDRMAHEIRASEPRRAPTVAIKASAPTVTAAPVVPPAPVASSVVQAPSGRLWDVVNAVFGEYAAKAWRVADCEAGYKVSAGYDPVYLNRVNIGSQGERSIWQIHPIHRQYDPLKLSGDIWYAAQVAYELSRGGTDWSPWSCGGA